MAEVLENVRWKGWQVGALAVGAPPPSSVSSQPLTGPLILVGTGNPGICRMYRDFAVSLHQQCQIPVWVLGLIGFDSEELLELDKIDLDLQVQMKKDFIVKYLSGVRVICVDHSTSCYIHLKLLEDDQISPQIENSYLLMPVLTVPDGTVWQFLNYGMRTKLFDVAEKIMASFGHIPMKPKKIVVDNFYKLILFKRPPNLEHFTSTTIQMYFHLARLLFDQPLELSLLEKFSNRLNIFCSNSDFLLHSQIKDYAKNCDRAKFGNVPHGFFVDHSIKFGEFVGDWIARDRLENHAVSTEIRSQNYSRI